MPTMLRRTRNTLLGLAVLASLGFGASAALAEPLRVPTCTDPEADGACAIHPQCDRICDRIYGPGLGGWCGTNECCYCLA